MKVGKERGQEIALLMLNEGAETAFVIKVTGLALTVIEGLRESLENKV